MKAVFGLVGLLLALAIVGVVVKKQLDTTSQRVPALAPAVPAARRQRLRRRCASRASRCSSSTSRRWRG